MAYRRPTPLSFPHSSSSLRRTFRQRPVRADRSSTIPGRIPTRVERAGRGSSQNAATVRATHVPLSKYVARRYQGHDALVCDENKAVAVEPSNVTITNILRERMKKIDV